jgi:TPR repeat protein
MTQDPIGQAKSASERGDFETAIALLRPLAEPGDSEAQYQLGLLVLTECELISGREAFSLFRAAADHGHVEAMYRMATCPEFLSEPFTSPLSPEKAWKWLMRAAESGCIQAQYSVAPAPLSRPLCALGTTATDDRLPT